MIQSPRIGVRATRAADHGITVSTFQQIQMLEKLRDDGDTPGERARRPR